MELGTAFYIEGSVKVVRHGYRKKHVASVLLKVPIAAIGDLRQELLAEAGCNKHTTSNHETFEIIGEDGTIVITLSDGFALIGTGTRNW